MAVNDPRIAAYWREYVSPLATTLRIVKFKIEPEIPRFAEFIAPGGELFGVAPTEVLPRTAAELASGVDPVDVQLLTDVQGYYAQLYGLLTTGPVFANLAKVAIFRDRFPT